MPANNDEQIDEAPTTDDPDAVAPVEDLADVDDEQDLAAWLAATAIRMAQDNGSDMCGTDPDRHAAAQWQGYVPYAIDHFRWERVNVEEFALTELPSLDDDDQRDQFRQRALDRGQALAPNLLPNHVHDHLEQPPTEE